MRGPWARQDFNLITVKKNKRSLWSRWVPVIVWMGLIFTLSSISGLRSPLSSQFDLILRKLAHMTEFAILAFLSLRALAVNSDRVSRRSLIYAGILAGLYAVSDEFHQSFVRERVASSIDVGIDLVGVLIGLDLARRFFKRRFLL